MTIKIEPINNKYDPKGVQAAFNEYFTCLVKEEYKGTQLWKMEWGLIAIRLVLAFVIYKSYFHAAPFPFDKLLILYCLASYWILNGVIYVLEKRFVKNTHVCFEVQVENLPKDLHHLKKKLNKDSFTLKIGSDVVDFSSDFKLFMFVEDQLTETVVPYENYVHEDGNIDQEGLKKLFEKQIKSI